MTLTHDPEHEQTLGGVTGGSMLTPELKLAPYRFNENCNFDLFVINSAYFSFFPILLILLSYRVSS